MKVKFLGAAGTVTGSGYLVTSNSGQQILVDLGMFQGLPDLERLNYSPIQVDARNLSGVLLTHAHLDHCGRLPILEKMGLQCPIYMTPPTLELTNISLIDSANVGREDHPENILYTKEDVLRLSKKFKSVNYDEELAISEFKIIYRDAGHIIGSASIEITVDGQKIVFSGDLGNSPQDLQKPTETIKNAGVVVMESTYGDRLHPPGKPADAIQAEINAVEANGGTLLIPAFSLERTQEILHIISHLKAQNLVKAVTPVILDSPMAERATVVYEKYKSYLNSEVNEDFAKADPFDFPGFGEIRERKESYKIEKMHGAKVIIAGSGMMTGGRIVGHARTYLPKASTRLLIVGYQGEGTLGRELLERKRVVRIGPQQIQVSATISDIQTLSSHADQGQLMTWLKAITGVQKVILTHGEDGPRQTLAEKIQTDLRIEQIFRPGLQDEIML